ncbi:MAG: ribonuclease D [Anaerolineaceae bacterium]
MTNNDLLPEPIYIDSSQELHELINTLRTEKRIAVDTESDSLYVYHEKVCLIQFSTSTADYLVDPLSRIDISALGTIFADPTIEKVFHAAEYDVICLRRDYGFEFTNLFDTMQAARILGLSKLGLSSLLEEYFNVIVDKRFQKADWGKRPLSQGMIHYARLDTHYLIPLQEKLSSALQKSKQLKVAREDFLRIAHSTCTPNGKPLYTAVRGYHTLSPQQLAVLAALCKYRDHIAMQADLPPFKILSSAILLEIAKTDVSSSEDLSTIPGLSEKLFRRHTRGLLEAVNQGKSDPPIYLDHRVKPSEMYITRLESLKKWRLQLAREKAVESDVVLPREILEEIAKKNPSTTQELQTLMQDVPERFQQYHQSILRILKEQI